MKSKKLPFAGAAIALSIFSAGLAAQPAQAATYTFVGSFNVFDGPVWTSNPKVVSGVEAAALLFGGSASQYAISVNSNTADPSTITHTAWLDGWGDTTYLVTAASETYSLSSSGGAYNPAPAFSAYVCDHANCAAYGFPSSSGEAGLNYTNYVWRTTGVPEAGVWAMMMIGFFGLGAAMRVNRRAVQASGAVHA